MAKKLPLVDYEVFGYIMGTNKNITTRVRAVTTSEARKVISERVPELIVTAVYPVMEF